MKNPHGVPPTRYMKRKESEYAINCDYKCGPIFGCRDIRMGDNCNKEDSCFIDTGDYIGYECDPQYMKSLFVNSGGSNERNSFSVLDYEVFGIDYENKYIIDNLCKYPDIIWKYVETRDISEESLKQIDDEQDLLHDLDAIYNEDSNIRLKILRYIKTPSKFLVGSKLVSEQYDDILRKWLGNDDKWKLIYRTSEHGYTSSSFHEYCDNVKGPTLIVIKSSGGWIFGGYTTQSWSSGWNMFGIYYDIYFK